ncbi:MAG TPA: ribonuclease Z [Thermodesulfovibrionales bacterium]|nr:ribonuclease Z [Thermodesulfovibrionales bacterium]
MKVTFLGTNGWYDTATGNTICALLETESAFIVFDAGNGFHKLDAFTKPDKPLYLLLSHMHLDHVAGLHILGKFRFPQGLQIITLKETANALKRLINRPYTLPLNRLPYRVRVIELSEEVRGLPFSLRWRKLLHSSPCAGYRVSHKGKTVAYCTDTGYCKEAVQLARNADLLIAECSYKSGQYNEKWPHLNPEEAAKIAKEAKAKQLALAHFDASIYRTIEQRKEAEAFARKVFPNAFAAVDGMTVEP